MTFTREGLCRKLAGLAELAGSPQRIVVAFSGGLDSTVLLHALATTASIPEATLLAVHVNHGLHEDSDDWLRDCEAVAAEWGVDFEGVAAFVDRGSGQGPEASARQARYGALRRYLGRGDWLISAHHRDDQAETLLLNLMRGSGPSGLAGIGEVQPIGQGWLVRPMLDHSRRELLAYAERFGLGWIDDPSNEDRSLDRNFLRHEILPRLEARWPGASARLQRSAALASEAATMLDQLAELDRQGLGQRPDVLSLSGLRALPAERQRNLLRYTIRELGLPPPPAAVLYSLVTDLVPASDDAQPLVEWPGAQVRRYRDSVYILPEAPATVTSTETVFEKGRADLGRELGVLVLEGVSGTGLSTDTVRAGLRVRYRQGGEKIKPAGQSHTRTVKKLLQEAGIVPWMRDRLPLIYAAGELVAVADLWVAESAAGTPGTAVKWIGRPPLH